MSSEHKIIKGKVGLLKLAQELGNVSQACKILGYSCDSFYRYQQLYATGGELILKEIEISRKNPLAANRVEPHIEEARLTLAAQESLVLIEAQL